jgi:uncharacterized protein with GYD domain
MAKYVVLSELDEGGVERIKEDPSILQDVRQEVESLGGKVIDQYALLGSYDFLTIVEADDNETVARMSVELGTRLNTNSESHPAIPMEEFVTEMS